jgi:hypothetical protein
MKILIDISPEHYDRILSEFTEESRMYAILKMVWSFTILKQTRSLGQLKSSARNFMHE